MVFASFSDFYEVLFFFFFHGEVFGLLPISYDTCSPEYFLVNRSLNQHVPLAKSVDTMPKLQTVSKDFVIF